MSLELKTLKFIKNIPDNIKSIITEKVKEGRKITFLVGAGISAESGIPTFRGTDGYWTDGSVNYTPQEIGTKKMFNVNYNEVWRWYLYRISVCNSAKPNSGHIALSEIEKLIPSRFSLVSQNVDGLHFKNESKIENLFLIHGDLRYMRCSDECSSSLYEIPKELTSKERERKTPILIDELNMLVCPKCSSEARPHVLWFDEYYNDKHYQLNKVLRIAKETSLLFVIGTSGATSLPQRIVESTLSRNGVVIDINPNESELTNKLEKAKNGFFIRAKSSSTLESIRDIIQEESRKMNNDM